MLTKEDKRSEECAEKECRRREVKKPVDDVRGRRPVKRSKDLAEKELRGVSPIEIAESGRRPSGAAS